MTTEPIVTETTNYWKIGYPNDNKSHFGWLYFRKSDYPSPPKIVIG